MRLEMEHVWRTYQVGDEEVVALRDASVCIDSGELVAVVGPSGSGKSTFLQLVGLLDTPSQGAVRFDGRDVGALADVDRTRVRLESPGFVFQRFHLLQHLTALENVMLPMEAAGSSVDERFERGAGLLSAGGCWRRGVWANVCGSGRPSSRVASASEWRWRGRWPTVRA